MKEIQSAGGPLIGLDQDNLVLWTGVFGKTFVGEDSPFGSDYEAACRAEHVHTGRRGNTSEIYGLKAHGILINSPDYTVVLDLDQDAIYIVQVECCEPTWGIHLVKRSDFETAHFDRKCDVFFSCKSCIYILFDAAYAGYNVGDDYLAFDLEGGEYVFSTATHRPDDNTELILCKIIKRENAAG